MDSQNLIDLVRLAVAEMGPPMLRGVAGSEIITAHPTQRFMVLGTMSWDTEKVSKHDDPKHSSDFPMICASWDVHSTEGQIIPIVVERRKTAIRQAEQLLQEHENKPVVA